MTEKVEYGRLSWFIPLRLASYIIISLVVVLWMGIPSYLSPYYIVYSAFTLGFTLMIALGGRVRHLR